jgi:Fe-S-cluster containining protein
VSGDDPISRDDLERGLRFLNHVVTTTRAELLELGAQVVALTRALEARGVVAEDAVLEAQRDMALGVRAADEASPPLRVELSDELVDKYDVESPPIPCAELIPLCKARCCALTFRLSTQDLEGGQVRWDYGNPYWNARRADGYCVHNEPTQGCSVYDERPAVCRSYDCRNDSRIWLDFDRRIPAPDVPTEAVGAGPPGRRRQMDMEERAARRGAAVEAEDNALLVRRLK